MTMNPRASYSFKDAQLTSLLSGEGEFEEGVPMCDIMRVIESDKYTLLKYRKHETKGLRVLTEVKMKELMPRLFEDHQVGLFRSMILRKGTHDVLAFTPPKSRPLDRLDRVDQETPVDCEEFVEGTMITLFYDSQEDTWELATRSVLGGRNQFFQETPDKVRPTFRKMFLDAMTDACLEFEMLPTQYSYTFVVQHPCNRVVVPFRETALYLVAVYECTREGDGVRVNEYNPAMLSSLPEWESVMKRVKVPKTYSRVQANQLDQVKETYASSSTPYQVVGVMLRQGGSRFKLRNPVYERIRRLRGNQPKQQFQYLALRQQGKVSQFLKHFPEMKKHCQEWRDQVHEFTGNLRQCYLDVFVKHERPIQDIPFQYRPHVVALHEKYIRDMKPVKSYIGRADVIDYVNSLPVPRLMFCLNASNKPPQPKQEEAPEQSEQSEPETTEQASEEEQHSTLKVWSGIGFEIPNINM